MPNTKADKGPTWADAGEALDFLRMTYRVGTTLQLVPPVWVALSSRWTTWVVVVHLHAIEPPLGHLTSAQASWGFRGAVTSAPAAVLLVATKLTAWCHEQQTARLLQDTFSPKKN